jgi:hypothetical protein
MLLSVQCCADLFDEMHAQVKLSKFSNVYALAGWYVSRVEIFARSSRSVLKALTVGNTWHADDFLFSAHTASPSCM